MGGLATPSPRRGGSYATIPCAGPPGAAVGTVDLQGERARPLAGADPSPSPALYVASGGRGGAPGAAAAPPRPRASAAPNGPRPRRPVPRPAAALPARAAADYISGGPLLAACGLGPGHVAERLGEWERLGRRLAEQLGFDHDAMSDDQRCARDGAPPAPRRPGGEGRASRGAAARWGRAAGGEGGGRRET
jgi:hypothetical protein